MFWINYMLLCAQEGKTPNGLAKELGISSGSVTNWKRGKLPSESSLQKIADHFGLSIWDLLGEKNPDAQTDAGNKKESSSDEMESFVQSNFKKLSFQDRIYVINVIQDRLRNQESQDALEGSD